MKKLTEITAVAAVFTLAVCFILLGAVSIELMAALGINEARFGTLVMSFFITCCISQLLIGPLVDKAGYKPVAITGFLLTSLSMFILAFASTFTLSLIACILLGIGAMSVNTVGNTLIPVVLFGGNDPARASNFGNGFFGLGYTLTPLLIVFIIKALGLDYSAALIILGILTTGFLVLTFFTEFPSVSTGFSFSMALSVITKPAVLIAAAALFCYTSLESSMGTWIKKLMEQLYGAGADINAAAKSGVILSLFGVAMMTGRFLFSLVKNLTSIGSRVLISMSVLSLAAILIMISTGSIAGGIISVLLAGIAFAPIFPTIVGITFSRFDKSLYGSIFGVIFSCGLMGGIFVPKIIGNISVGSTVQQGLMITAIFAVILLGISLVIGRIGARSSGTGAEKG